MEIFKTQHQVLKPSITEQPVLNNKNIVLSQKNENKSTPDDVKSIIEKLNLAISPFDTNIKFGFDNKSNVFFISVIDIKTNQVLRRFPLEEAEILLAKVEDVKGIIFDDKG